MPDQTCDNALYLKHDNALLYCVPQNYFMYTLLHTIVINRQVAYHITQFQWTLPPCVCPVSLRCNCKMTVNRGGLAKGRAFFHKWIMKFIPQLMQTLFSRL